MLTKPHDANLGLQVWSAFGGMSMRQGKIDFFSFSLMVPYGIL